MGIHELRGTTHALRVLSSRKSQQFYEKRGEEKGGRKRKRGRGRDGGREEEEQERKREIGIQRLAMVFY